MPRFTTAPVEQVAPKRRQRQPSQRSQIRKQYQDALRDAVAYKHEALVVELDPADKPLTVRNRIKRAAESLGIDGLVVRRRKNRIIAYVPGEAEEH
jgi:tRNA (Thr-GGU) A37 N-methylase